MLRRHNPGRTLQVPPIDFSRQEAFLVAAGPRSSTGYALRIVRVEEDGGPVDVVVRERTPSLGDPVQARVTYPFRLLALPQRQARATEVARTPVTDDDPLIKQLRQQISDTDRSIVDAINTRLRLVARLKSYKESRGIDFLDPEREEWMLQYLQRANRGPLSQDGLQELFEEILDLTKREVQRGEDADTRRT